MFQYKGFKETAKYLIPIFTNQHIRKYKTQIFRDNILLNPTLVDVLTFLKSPFTQTQKNIFAKCFSVPPSLYRHNKPEIWGLACPRVVCGCGNRRRITNIVTPKNYLKLSFIKRMLSLRDDNIASSSRHEKQK